MYIIQINIIYFHNLFSDKNIESINVHNKISKVESTSIIIDPASILKIYPNEINKISM